MAKLSAPEGTIVGVAADAHSIKVDANDVAELYRPLKTEDFAYVELVARARTDADRLLPILREAAMMDPRVIPAARAMHEDFDRRMAQDEISWIGEAEVLTRYHITPNCSLRAGLEFMVIDSLALAPRQINFLNVSNWIETGGNPWYMGGLFGFECYW